MSQKVRRCRDIKAYIYFQGGGLWICSCPSFWKEIWDISDDLLLTKRKFSGEIILLALENGVSKYPELEGRFPQVAGVKFAFDPDAPPGSRVDPLLVRIGDEYLVMNQNYKLSTKNYLHNGCDGYTMLHNCEELVSECYIVYYVFVVLIPSSILSATFSYSFARLVKKFVQNYVYLFKIIFRLLKCVRENQRGFPNTGRV